MGAYPACQSDADRADGTEGELKQDALKRGIAECRHNKGTEAGDSSIHRVSRTAISLEMLRVIGYIAQGGGKLTQQPS